MIDWPFSHLTRGRKATRRPLLPSSHREIANPVIDWPFSHLTRGRKATRRAPFLSTSNEIAGTGLGWPSSHSTRGLKATRGTCRRPAAVIDGEGPHRADIRGLQAGSLRNRQEDWLIRQCGGRIEP